VHIVKSAAASSPLGPQVRKSKYCVSALSGSKILEPLSHGRKVVEGISLGNEDGSALGKELGDNDGSDDGSELGEVDGLKLGISLGTEVGSKLGIEDGSTLGSVDG